MTYRCDPLLAPKPYCMQMRDSVWNGGGGAGAWESPQKGVSGKPGRSGAVSFTAYPESSRIADLLFVEQNTLSKRKKDCLKVQTVLHLF